MLTRGRGEYIQVSNLQIFNFRIYKTIYNSKNLKREINRIGGEGSDNKRRFEYDILT